MRTKTGLPVLVLFQEMTVATVDKARNQSNRARTGGGARDLRVRPYDQLKPFMEKLFPGTRSKVGGTRPGLVVRSSKVTWGDGSQSREIEYWPPTKARASEGRIGRISTLPPLRDPPNDPEGFVVLFVRDANDVLWVRYATVTGLRQSMPQIGKFIRQCLNKKGNNNAATGYIDLSPGGLGSWCNR